MMPNAGKNRKNNLYQRLDRRKRVAALYIQGQSQARIAEQVGVAQGTISYDLQAIRKEWLASSVRDFDEAKSQELAKLDHLEAEAWAGWERSCADGITNHERKEQVLRSPRKKGRKSKAKEKARLVVVKRILETTTRK